VSVQSFKIWPIDHRRNDLTGLLGINPPQGGTPHLWIGNVPTSTAVAVLSRRVREGASVSMPIHWKEICKGLEPKRFALRTVPPVLKRTRPWADYEKAARTLEAAIRSLTRK
jgi:hypothetical protein